MLTHKAPETNLRWKNFIDPCNKIRYTRNANDHFNGNDVASRMHASIRPCGPV
jgi:hypothetical protein